MTHTRVIRLEAEDYGVIEVNDKIVTYKNGVMYGVPVGDLTPHEEKTANNLIKSLERCTRLK